MKLVSFIIPVFNESRRIEHLFFELNKFMQMEHLFNKEVIIVNDGSTDNTYEQILDLSNKYSFQIKLINYKKNLGKGHAVKKGIEVSSGDIIGFLDADLATPLSEFELIFKYFNQANVYVIGSRVKSISHKSDYSILRKIASRVFHHIAISVLEYKVEDTQAGFKFFSSNLKEKLLQKLSQNGFAFDIEMTLIAQKSKFDIITHSITNWNNGAHSKVSILKDSYKMLVSVYKIFLKKKDKEYDIKPIEKNSLDNAA